MPLINTRTAFIEWTYKEGYSERDSSNAFSNIVTQKWKDFVDTCRYLAMEKRPFRAVPSRTSTEKRKPVVINRYPRDWEC